MMAGSTRSCCVPRCNTTHTDNITLHAFPHPEKEKERFMMWVNAVGSSLTSLDHHFLHKNRKICHNHFEERYLTWTRRLSAGAVPTLHIPCKVEELVPIESIAVKQSLKRKSEDIELYQAVKGVPIVFAGVKQTSKS